MRLNDLQRIGKKHIIIIIIIIIMIVIIYVCNIFF
jgi:hypothetical protein